MRRDRRFSDFHAEQAQIDLPQQSLVSKALVGVYFVLAGVYWTPGTDVESVAGRIGPAEGWMAVLGVYALITSGGRWHVSRLVACLSALLLILALSVGLNGLHGPQVLSWAIHAYVILSFCVIFDLIVRWGPRAVDAVGLWNRCAGLIALIGLIDFLAGMAEVSILPRSLLL